MHRYKIGGDIGLNSRAHWKVNCHCLCSPRGDVRTFLALQNRGRFCVLPTINSMETGIDPHHAHVMQLDNILVVVLLLSTSTVVLVVGRTNVLFGQSFSFNWFWVHATAMVNLVWLHISQFASNFKVQSSSKWWSCLLYWRRTTTIAEPPTHPATSTCDILSSLNMWHLI